MAEFLIRVQDKVNPDSPYKDVKCMKRGDVISVCPDGWVWSVLELTVPHLRIVKCAGMALDEAEAFLAPEPGDPLLNRMLQLRQFKLDVNSAALPAAIRNWIADDTRTQPFLAISLARVRGAKFLKPPVPDPGIIG